MIYDISYKELIQIIKGIPIVIVNFWSPRSDHAINMNMELEKQLLPKIGQSKKIALVKVNIEKNQSFVQGLNIIEIPCIMIFFNGTLLELQNNSHGKLLKIDRFVAFDVTFPEKIWNIIEVMIK